MEDKKKQDKPIQPFYLPQVNCPYSFICSNLKEFGINHKMVIISVGQLKPMQKQVDFDKVKKIAQENKPQDKPIFISENNFCLDGHHRLSSVKYREGDKGKIKAMRLMCDEKHGATALKLIQDRFEQQNKHK